MPEAKLFLPWPDKVLSPNARKHWTVVAKAKKKAKNDTYYAVLEQGTGLELGNDHTSLKKPSLQSLFSRLTNRA